MLTRNQTQLILMSPLFHIPLLGLDLFQFGIRIMLCEIVVLQIHLQLSC